MAGRIVLNIGMNIKAALLVSLAVLPRLFTAPCCARAAEEYPPEVLAALEKAGGNRPEIEKTLQYFREAGDPLKLKAAYFLTANMPGQNYAQYELRNSSGASVPFDPLAHAGYEAMVKAWNETEKIYGPMDWKAGAVTEDISSLKSSALIENINLAFKAWREKPWAAGVPFDDFLEYVLPYRASNEPVEPWRAYFLEKYKDLPSEMKNPRDLTEAAALINEDIKKWFKFDPIFYRHPTDQGLAEMLRRGAGRCEDMTNLAIYAMRANAIPVAGDYTPYWANTGNNHAWNALIIPGAPAVPFMGALEDPGVYRLGNRPAKAYRSTFGRQSGSLAAGLGAKEKAPRWFKKENYKDVTDAYAETGTIEIEMAAPPSEDAKTPYLAVFNSGEWQIIGWGTFRKGKARFENYAKGIVYLPVYYSSGTAVPAGPAFIYTGGAEVRALIPSKVPAVTVRAASTTRRTIAHTTDNIARTFLTPGKIYELHYWNGKWLPISEQKAGKDRLKFKDVPNNALLWLKEKGSGGEERIFTYDAGAQVWW